MPEESLGGIVRQIPDSDCAVLSSRYEALTVIAVPDVNDALFMSFQFSNVSAVQRPKPDRSIRTGSGDGVAIGAKSDAVKAGRRSNPALLNAIQVPHNN